jgi:hypothetical protein
MELPAFAILGFDRPPENVADDGDQMVKSAM